jgi:hypothetical protein
VIDAFDLAQRFKEIANIADSPIRDAQHARARLARIASLAHQGTGAALGQRGAGDAQSGGSTSLHNAGPAMHDTLARRTAVRRQRAWEKPRG